MLYNKNPLIRLLVIDAIERIEIAARSAWVQKMSMKHGPHCYLVPQLFLPVLLCQAHLPVLLCQAHLPVLLCQAHLPVRHQKCFAIASGGRRPVRGNAAAWATAAEEKLMGYRANKRSKLSEDY